MQFIVEIFISVFSVSVLGGVMIAAWYANKPQDKNAKNQRHIGN